MRSPLFGQNPNTLSARVTLNPYTPRPGSTFGEGADTQVLQMQGDDDDARTLVVAFQPLFTGHGTNGPPHPFPLLHGPCVATVEWGTGSQTIFAEVDVGKGTALTIAASTVRLTARNDGRALLVAEDVNEFGDTLPALSLDPSPAPQDVIAMIGGAGLRGSRAAPTRTYYGARLRSGEGATFPVPPFAKSVRVSRSPMTTALGLTINAGLGGGVIRAGEELLLPGEQRTFVPLFDLADTLRVRNVGAGVVDAFQVQFELGGL